MCHQHAVDRHGLQLLENRRKQQRLIVNMVLNVHRNRTAYLGRREGGGGMEVGEEGDYIPIATLSPLIRMTSALRWAAMRAILMFQ